MAFLGALHWGPALNGSAKQPALLLAWGVVPSLMAWFALQWAGAQTGKWLAAGLMVALAGGLSVAYLLLTRSPLPTPAQRKPLAMSLLGNVIGYPLLLGWALLAGRIAKTV